MTDCCSRGDQVPAIDPMAPGLSYIAAHRGAHAVAHCDTDVLHHRIVTIAIDHTTGAVAHALRSVKVSDVAKRSVPVVAAPELQVPIQIEEFPPRETHLWLAAQVTLHVFDRRNRVQLREMPARHFYGLKRRMQLLGRVIDQRRLGTGEIGSREGS